MMKKSFIKHTLLLFIGVFAFVNIVSAQVPEEILFSLKTGSASNLAKHFNQNVELVVLGDDNVYSKAHAQQVLSDFFKNYPPKDFTIIHQGGKSDSKYAIGTLVSDKGVFRVYFLLKSRNNTKYIHQLRITKEND